MTERSVDNYELPDEIDFSKMKRVPNPFVQDFRELNLVSLEPELKAEFPDSPSVNAALRELLERRKKDRARADAA